MNKFNNILIATDLDGTLLKKDKSISKENKEAVEYFKSNGGIFTVITGRTPLGAKPVWDILRPNAPLGCMNGGGMYDCETEKMLWSLCIEKTSCDFIKYAQELVPDIGVIIVTEENMYCCKRNSFTEKHRTDEKLDEKMIDYRDIYEPLAKIMFADNPKNIDKIANFLPKNPLAEKFTLLRSDSIYYEVLPKNSSKGNLLEKIAEYCGIDMKNTIAVGDNDNDVSMILKAGTGIAVSNASEAAKKAADIITVANEENAIEKIIENLDKKL